jgi:hypothetical protein
MENHHHDHHHHLLKSFRKGSSKAVHKAGGAIAHFFHGLEDFFFPKSPLHTDFEPHVPKVRGGVLLDGCHTAEEHRVYVQQILNRIRKLNGAQGLAAAGLEYRMLYCEAHRHGGGETTSSGSGLLTENTLDESSNTVPSSYCYACMRRLYHVESDTLLTMDNRKRWIADGDMYEEIARLCQQVAHQIMCDEADLEWVVIDSQDEAKEPIRALVNSDHPLLNKDSAMANRPSLLIATGRGKVRAGIFSRQHLICSGMESATALPIVREAKRRNLNVVIVDPNVHGDHMGFVTFEKTMDYISGLFDNTQPDVHGAAAPLQPHDLYVLSHSASGGHLARYLLDKADHCLPHLKAIAFTDSTHNIQWAKTRNLPDLYDMLESSKCVYFRCSKVRTAHEAEHAAGEEVQTDQFWRHRFGKIRTYWAGTNEHSMTNWHAREKIWEHFDHHLESVEEEQ